MLASCNRPGAGRQHLAAAVAAAASAVVAVVVASAAAAAAAAAEHLQTRSWGKPSRMSHRRLLSFAFYHSLLAALPDIDMVGVPHCLPHVVN